MPVNKNALLRYITLDKCFQNHGRKYTFEDLRNELNNALKEDNPKHKGVSDRSIRKDIQFMKSGTGYNAPIETYDKGYKRDDIKPGYRYTDPNFSIRDQPLNSTEAEQLKHALSVLNRFEGAPGFEWVREMNPILRERLDIKPEESEGQSTLFFDSNIDYSGHEFITPIFNGIVNKRALRIEYKPFNKESYVLCFHAQVLKQFNNRWFTFGPGDVIEGKDELSDYKIIHLALDRIQDISETETPYTTTEIKWEEYLDNVVGVSIPEGEPVEVVLKFNAGRSPYIKTKPIHMSQKFTLLEDGTSEVRLNVIPNHELTAQILSYGDHVEVLKPETLRKEILQKIQTTAKLYDS